VRALKGHEVEVATLAFKAGDALYGTFGCRSVDTLLVFGSNGRVYSVGVATLPGGRGDGVPITTLIDLEAGSTIAHYLAGAGETTLLLSHTGGFGLLAQAKDLHGRNKGGKAFLTIEPGEMLLPPVALAAGHEQVACLSLDGRLLVFPLAELKMQRGGGRGLTLMDVDAKSPLVSATPFAAALRVSGSGRGGKAKEEDLRGAALALHVGRRARKGRKLEGFPKPQRVSAL
jgi:topoisomerase IV subunit A